MLLLLLLTFSASTVAQTKKIYYDNFFRSVSVDPTPYYRILDDRDSVVLVSQYSGDTLTTKGYVMPGPHSGLVDEFVHFVANNGNPYLYKSEFAAMRCEFDYYTNRQHCWKIVSRSGKIFQAQVISETGEPLLTNGTGTSVQEQAGSTRYEFYADSVLTEMYEVRSLEKDTIYYTYDRMAEPYDGYPAFMKDLVKILKYPGLARWAGKEGVVYIQFMVDKKGRLTEFKPLTNEGYNLEKRAVEHLEQMPDWNPAIFRNRPVKMKFTVPIRFRLR